MTTAPTPEPTPAAEVKAVETTAIVGAKSVGTSIVRTTVPIAVGFVVSLLAHIGIKNPVAVSGIGAIAASAYYSGIHLAEQKVPKLGYLLGALGVPTTPAK